MFRKAFFLVFVVSLCSFKDLSSAAVEIITQNIHDKQLDKNLGKRISSFTSSLGDSFYYTTKLSRILLVGEHRAFESVQWLPVINSLSILGPLFHNRLYNSRFDKFITHVEKSSQNSLKEAIKDAVLLAPYNSKAYWADDLLDYLVEVLEKKIAEIADINDGCVFDPRSLHCMKKYMVVTALLMGVSYMTDSPDSKNSNLEFINSLSSLGLIPSSYKLLKSSYNTITIYPQHKKKYLNKYEELLSYVQALKQELAINGCVVFELSNGLTAILEDNGRQGVFKQQILSFKDR